jgi:hypothetical protein
MSEMTNRSMQPRTYGTWAVSRHRARRLVRSAGRAVPAPIAEPLEARRLLASDIVVVSTATIIEDGETVARPFGYEQLGQSVRTKQFTVSNIGLDPATLSDLSVPEGFRILESFTDSTLEQGDVATFTVSLDPNSTAGDKTGDIVFTVTDNEGASTFNFAVEGTLTPSGGPRVVGFTPDNRGGVWIDFDEALDADTVNTDTVLIFAAGTDGELGTDDDEAVAGTVSYDATRRQVLFVPDTRPRHRLPRPVARKRRDRHHRHRGRGARR